MERREFVKHSGIGLAGHQITPSQSKSATRGEKMRLLNGWFEVKESGNATFVLRFAPDVNVWDSDSKANELKSSISVPELPRQSLQFQSKKSESYVASTLPLDENERVSRLGTYNEETGPNCSTMYEVIRNGRKKGSLKPRDQPYSRYTEVATDRAIEEPYDAKVELEDINVGGWRPFGKDTQEMYWYAKPKNMLGGTIEDFTEIQETDMGPVYLMKSPFVFGDKINTKGALLSIKFPPGVTYTASSVHNKGLPADYASSYPNRAQLPAISHYANSELGAIANGARFTREAIKTNLRNDLFDRTTYDEYTSGEARRLYNNISETLQDVMIDLIGTYIPGPPIDTLVESAMMAMNPGYCRLDHQLSNIENEFESAMNVWVDSVEESHKELRRDLRAAESLAFESTAVSTPSDAVQPLSELQSVLKRIKTTADEGREDMWPDGDGVQHVPWDSPFFQFAQDVFTFVERDFADTALKLVEDEQKRLERLSPMRGPFSESFEGGLTRFHQLQGNVHISSKRAADGESSLYLGEVTEAGKLAQLETNIEFESPIRINYQWLLNTDNKYAGAHLGFGGVHIKHSKQAQKLVIVNRALSNSIGEQEESGTILDSVDCPIPTEEWVSGTISISPSSIECKVNGVKASAELEDSVSTAGSLVLRGYAPDEGNAVYFDDIGVLSV